MTKAIKNTSFALQVLLFCFLLFLPLFVFGQSSPSTGIVYECVTAGGTYGNCSFNDLILATERVIRWAVIFTLQFSVVVIAYAGYLYMISGANPGKRKEANAMLTKVAIGIFFILAAYLIVTLIANALLTPAVKGVTPVITAP